MPCNWVRAPSWFRFAVWRKSDLKAQISLPWGHQREREHNIEHQLKCFESSFCRPSRRVIKSVVSIKNEGSLEVILGRTSHWSVCPNFGCYFLNVICTHSRNTVKRFEPGCTHNGTHFFCNWVPSSETGKSGFKYPPFVWIQTRLKLGTFFWGWGKYPPSPVWTYTDKHLKVTELSALASSRRAEKDAHKFGSQFVVCAHCFRWLSFCLTLPLPSTWVYWPSFCHYKSVFMRSLLTFQICWSQQTLAYLPRHKMMYKYR